MFRPMPLLVGAALVLVALGGYDVYRGDARPAATIAPAALPPPNTLSTATMPLGTVVTSAGATLYRYDKDSAKPPRSVCAGQCAVTWPPVLSTGGKPQLSGIDPTLVGAITRVDGTRQLTLGGWPLYRFTGDTAPGQVRGEGRSGAWHAVGPTGKPAATRKTVTSGATGTGAATGRSTPTIRATPKATVKATPKPAPTAGTGSSGGYGY